MTITRRRRLASMLLACLLVLPVLAAFGRSARAAVGDPPAWSLSWSLNRSNDIDELSRNFDHDENGVIDQSADPAGRLPGILNPDQSTLHVGACNAPPGFTSIDWTLTRPGESPLPSVSTTECETDLVLPDKPFPVAREYTLTATLHYADTDPVVVESAVRVQDVFMVAFGDSYGSGEGNPLTKDEWFGSQESTWDNKRCHRSRLSGQEIAAHELDSLAGVNVTLLHLSCSGALAAAGILQPYMGIEPKNDHLPPLPPQIDQAEEYVGYTANAAGEKRYPDVVLTSIGGNDAGFADIVKGCIAFPDWAPIPIPVFPYVIPFDFDECYEQGEVGDVRFQQGLSVLPGLYRQIEDKVHGTANTPGLCNQSLRCDFLITEYPDGATDENGHACSVLPGFTEDEFQWVIDEMVPTLNNLIKASAEENGWAYVDGVRSNFDRHGVCAEHDYFRDVLESHDIQSGIDGAFHPNTSGHLWGYAPAIVDSLREQLGFPYSFAGAPLAPPPYAGLDVPADCDATIGDGNRERTVVAPPTSPAALNLPADIAEQLVDGRLPSGLAYGNSCANLAQAATPGGQAPRDLRAGATGCSDDARVCLASNGSGGLLQLPVWGDQAPLIRARGSADATGSAGQQLPTVKHRTSSGGAEGTTAFFAAPNGGSATVSGEVDVDFDAIAQSGGARAYSLSTVEVDVVSVVAEESCGDDGYCSPSTSTPIAGLDLTIHRNTCQVDDESGYQCGPGELADGSRSEGLELRAWAGDQTIADESGSDTYPYSTNVGIGAGVPVGAGLRSPGSTLRLPYSVPAGSVVLVTVRTNAYTSVGEECTLEWIHFPCSSQARASADVAVDADGATGVLVPLSGFVAPVATDNTAPTVSAQTSGPAGANGWFRGPAQVLVTAVDDAAGSGVQSVTTTLDANAPRTTTGPTTTVDVTGDGADTVSYTAKDASGNTSQPGTTTVRIDHVAPAVTITTLDDSQYNQGAVVGTGLACADATSGIAACTGPATLDTSTPGAHTATFDAVDVAGNTARRSVSYRVLATARDTIELRIPELGYTIKGALADGDFDLRKASNGQLNSVTGVGVFAKPDGSRVTVTVAVVRLLGVWVGVTNVSDPSAKVNVAAATSARNSVVSLGSNGARGVLTSAGSPKRTIDWTITDLA